MQVLNLCSPQLLIIGLLFMISCSSDSNFFEPVPSSDQNAGKSYDNVDARLWPYYENFEFEAAIRGIDIDLQANPVTAEISNISAEDVAGTCHFGTHIQNHITIDNSFWTSTNNLWREFVVFHELGHCTLHRDHYEGEDQNGSCLSIMASGTGGCQILYSAQNRAFYLDELFSRN